MTLIRRGLRPETKAHRKYIVPEDSIEALIFEHIVSEKKEGRLPNVPGVPEEWPCKTGNDSQRYVTVLRFLPWAPDEYLKQMMEQVMGTLSTFQLPLSAYSKLKYSSPYDKDRWSDSTMVMDDISKVGYALTSESLSKHHSH